MQTSLAGKIADTLNDIIDQNERMATELQRIGNVVGKEGKITERASLGNLGGSCSDCVTSVNTLITDLVQPTAETTRVIRAVANGDLSQTIATEIDGRPLQGEFLQTANIVNTMVDRLGSFASEVTRVAREVGTEGKLGVQAEVKGVAGTWKDLTDNVNLMAGNLTGQVRDHIERTFRQIAQDKGISFSIELASELPRTIYSDAKRLQQVLKNLLSNAFKFTEHGEVSLRIEVAKQGWSLNHETLNRSQIVIAFSVTDTGIGIAPDKQKVIFEAFQQADGTTSRKYGGTGLGLSISREIARLFGGEIKLVSHPDQGSTFTFYLPQFSSEVGVQISEPKLQLLSAYSPSTIMNDDRTSIEEGDHVLLIVEDDIYFARILLDLARQQGFKVIAAQNGRVGLTLAQEYQPSGILLDVRLPEMDGWTVLDRLKHDPNTRHIPVHIMTVEEGRQRSLELGAIAYVQKPVNSETVAEALNKIKGFVQRRVKDLLVVEDDNDQRRSIIELIGSNDVKITAVETGAAALAAVRSQLFDCLILDLELPDMSGFELIEQLKQDPNGEALPIIVYTSTEISTEKETELKRIAETIIVKDVRTPEGLLDETALVLHRIQADLSEPKRQMLKQLHSSAGSLARKKVLIVDDDIRNILALTSMLERYQMQVLYAENGSQCMSILENTPDVDVVLMDVMMPEMDGHETTRLIRQNDRFTSLPIIALTAKAMQGDRDKCIQAGASDYITKPVDIEQLLSLLRVCLYR